MPLEHHYERVNTPLRGLTSRERNVLIWGLVATIACIVAIVIATAGKSAPAPAAGCVSTSVAGVMGAQPLEACGGAAHRLCARRATQTDPGSVAVQADCRRAGLLP